jgi:hypothetical protein
MSKTKDTELMQLIGSWHNGVDNATLWRGDGQNVSHSGTRRMNNPRYRQAFVRFEEAYLNAMAGSHRAHRFVRACLEGDVGALQVLHEAISPSDFPLILGDTIDRIVLAKFKSVSPTWEQYMKVGTVQDFRAVERYRCSLGRGVLPVVGVGGSYTFDKPGESHYTFSVQKRGGVRPIYWETLINDDLGALQDTPADMARQATNTEAYVATSLFAANTTLYAINHTAEDGNTYSNKGTAKFSANALAAALSVMGEYPGDDVDGMPIMNDPVYIVVGTKDMEFRVNQVLSSQIVQYVDVAGGDGTNLPTGNLLSVEVRQRLKCVFNPFLRLFDTNYRTSWYLFADPADIWAVEFARLAGYEAPQLFMEASAQLGLSGGLASPMDGSFSNDTVNYKVRVVMGGSHTNAVGGWRGTYMSDGTA